MADTPKTPIEIMKAAHFAEAGRWTVAYSDDGIVVARFDKGEWEAIETHENPQTAMERRMFLAFDAGQRAALRALAEMEWPEDSIQAALDGYHSEESNDLIIGIGSSLRSLLISLSAK
jgi:hypothetical protein